MRRTQGTGESSETEDKSEGSMRVSRREASTPAGTQQRTISLKTATREELVAFIKDYRTHTKEVEAQCANLHEAAQKAIQ